MTDPPENSASDCLPNTAPSQSRVFLWCLPRSVSTSFLKCMTFVENSQIWHEPYMWANLCGPDGSYHARDQPGEFSLDLDSKDTGGHGYDAVNCSFSRLKNQFESKSSSAKLIFVKDMGHGIDGHYDAIPIGFRHSFWIRHPYKVFPSVRRIFHRDNRRMHIPLTELPVHDIPKGYFYKELWDLYQHIKDTYEPDPVIIDSDDLLRNPRGILEAYCREMNIPFKETLLQWPAGDGVMYGKWKIQKQVICLHQVAGLHEGTFESTCFSEPTVLPSRSILSPDAVRLADASMSYYNELYKRRLQL